MLEIWKDGKDVIQSDRINDIYPNITLTDEGCIYDSINYTSKKVKNICHRKSAFTFENTFTNQGTIQPKNSLTHNIDLFHCSSFYSINEDMLSNYGFYLGSSIAVIESCLLLISFSSHLSGITLIGRMLIKLNPPLNKLEKDYDDCIMHYSWPMVSTIREMNDSLIYTIKTRNCYTNEEIQVSQATDIQTVKNENNDSNKELIKVNQILHYSFLSVFWSLYSKQNIILRTFIKNSNI